jgi:hypothetical protein
MAQTNEQSKVSFYAGGSSTTRVKSFNQVTEIIIVESLKK